MSGFPEAIKIYLLLSKIYNGDIMTKNNLLIHQWKDFQNNDKNFSILKETLKYILQIHR